jgi:hypothetical protein
MGTGPSADKRRKKGRAGVWPLINPLLIRSAGNRFFAILRWMIDWDRWLITHLHRACRLPQPLADRLEDHVQRRDREDADERRREHATEHRRADIAPRQP